MAARQRLRDALEAKRCKRFKSSWLWAVGFWGWTLTLHVAGIAYFTSGFLLTRLVLKDRSSCDVSPLADGTNEIDVLPPWPGKGTVEGGCWYPKTFDRAVVLIIDALRYDFTVPVGDGAEFHDALPVLHDMALQNPANAFLRPFIADPPTTTLQRLKGLTTGTLPTFIDAGSNFAGTAIDEDNLLLQLRDSGKKLVHLGDDTWDSLFPEYFDRNLSHPYDSFNVWDLHTVDNGVIDHIFPVLDTKDDWDVVIGHCLGVDHAGHRYGPAHVEMTKKLQQMNKFIEDLVARIDEQTLLVVMGDHGMDAKGDHGGESEDEVEAALWMYSKRPVFGRTKLEYTNPPANAKIRPVNQIDLVPTLALLLGVAIPFNNLGRPIEEAFAGSKGDAWAQLAAAERTAAAGIKRYQASYFAARGIEQDSRPGSAAELWQRAEALLYQTGKQSRDWPSITSAFSAYQEETLRKCKGLWARFDITNMVLGVGVMACGLVVLLLYVSRDQDDDELVTDNVELDLAEQTLEMQGDSEGTATTDPNRRLVQAALAGAVSGAVAGLVWSSASGADDLTRTGATAAITSAVFVLYRLLGAGKTFSDLAPTNIWTWMAVIFTVSQAVGFASNSYTIWEDSISLFFLTTFGVAAALSCFRLPRLPERYMGIYHSVLFTFLANIASYSKLCREEQMPYCLSTYYASETSSTSAPWQLVIPFAVFLILPSIIKEFMTPTKSYDALAPTWIGYVFRAALCLSAIYWALDAADNGGWFSSFSDGSLKTMSVYVAQLVLALVLVAGSTAFAWAPPCVSVLRSTTQKGRAQITVLGYGNAHGSRYLLLPLNLFSAVFLLSKPMGGGALALMLVQILSLVEILDLNALTTSAIGPVVLALMGNFYYFKTGHQAVLSSIQWDSAFIPLFTIRYPWSPLAVALNHFAGQILAATAVPLLVLWKADPRRKGLLPAVLRALGLFTAFYAVQSMATMAWAGWLRRHLMLYRVFSPRFMMAAAALVLVDVIAIAVALTGVRANSLAISEVFGWAE